MLWTWLFLWRGELRGQVKTRFHLQTHNAFRMLLIGSDILILLSLCYIQRCVPHHQVYDLWLAGLTATIGILLLCTIGSARINGYRRSFDFWMKLATACMFMLGFVALVGTFSGG